METWAFCQWESPKNKMSLTNLHGFIAYMQGSRFQDSPFFILIITDAGRMQFCAFFSHETIKTPNSTNLFLYNFGHPSFGSLHFCRSLQHIYFDKKNTDRKKSAFCKNVNYFRADMKDAQFCAFLSHETVRTPDSAESFFVQFCALVAGFFSHEIGSPPRIRYDQFLFCTKKDR